jgi:hypothetical protein
VLTSSLSLVTDVSVQDGPCASTEVNGNWNEVGLVSAEVESFDDDRKGESDRVSW